LNDRWTPKLLYSEIILTKRAEYINTCHEIEITNIFEIFPDYKRTNFYLLRHNITVAQKNILCICEGFRFVTYTCCYFRTFIPDLPQHLPTFTRQTGRDVRTGSGSLNLVGVRGNEKRPFESPQWPWFYPVTSRITKEHGSGTSDTHENFSERFLLRHYCTRMRRPRMHIYMSLNNVIKILRHFRHDVMYHMWFYVT